MNESTVQVLLVESDQGEADHFEALVHTADPPEVAVHRVMSLADALTALVSHRYDAVVVDPGVDGPGAVARLREQADTAALLVLRTAISPIAAVTAADVGGQDLIDLTSADERTLGLTLRHAVERARLTDALQQARERGRALARAKGLRDPLTGLAMAETLMSQLDTFIADAIRFARPLTVVVTDIDSFSELNATRGPGVGDATLIHLAGLLMDEMRASDVVGRLGADEFLLMLPGTRGQAALVALERIQRRMQLNPYKLRDGRRLHISMSCGVAALTGLDSSLELLARADRALAEARSRGRGRIGLDPYSLAGASASRN